MSATPFVWLRRAFDLVCAVAGLALLAFLGPYMLISAATSHVPEAHELTRVVGITTACRPVFGGVRLLLKDYETQFQLPIESCVAARVELSQRVGTNVMPADLRDPRAHAAIPSFGFDVEGRVVHTLGEDLGAARLDQAFVIAIGIPSTLVLLWLTWTIVTRRGSLRKLLLGEWNGID